MRLPGARLAVALAVTLVAAESASATPLSGSMTRVSDNVVRVTLTNNGSSDDIGVAVEFHPPVTVVSASRVSGPPGNCAPDGGRPNRLLCLLDPPGLAPGASIVIDVQTNPRVEDNAGANAYSCGIPCNTSMMSGPYAISGPPPAAPLADLGVTFETLIGSVQIGEFGFETFEYDLVPNRRRSWMLRTRAVVTNYGFADAVPTSLVVRADDVPLGTKTLPIGKEDVRIPAGTGGTCELNRGSGALAPAQCRYDRLVELASATLIYSVSFTDAGSFRLTATAATNTPEANNHPNSATISDDVVAEPFSSSLVLRNGKTASGRIKNGGRALFVSIAKEEGGAKLGEPASSSSADADITGRASAAGCRWVTSVRVRLRRERGRRCDEPSYLRAKVRRGRWKLALRRKLPPGRYVLFTQAMSADGVLELAVGPKLGNLTRLRVR